MTTQIWLVLLSIVAFVDICVMIWDKFMVPKIVRAKRQMALARLDAAAASMATDIGPTMDLFTGGPADPPPPQSASFTW